MCACVCTCVCACVCACVGGGGSGGKKWVSSKTEKVAAIACEVGGKQKTM